MKYCDICHNTYPADFSSCPKDQGPLRNISEFGPGMVIHDKYEILDKIGVGGMATVYKAKHLHFNEELAIKVVSSRLLEDETFLKRFKTEAVITRKLRHPNAVRLDDFDTTEDGRPFIVMEYVQGKSLRSVLMQRLTLPVGRSLNIARQAALGLNAAHQLGIVHRDIKPDNILIVKQPDGSDLVKVLDFGIAKVREGAFDAGPGHNQTQTGMVLGTPQYISPEQAMGKRGEEVDGRADLYALGVVLYEMLTGQLPFQSDTPLELLLHHIQTVPTPPHVLRPEKNIPMPVSQLLMKALAKDRKLRFQTGEEMAEALGAAATGTYTALPVVEEKPATTLFGTAALAAAHGAKTPEQPAPMTQGTKVLGSDQIETVRTKTPVAAPAPGSKKKWFVIAGVATVFLLIAGFQYATRRPPLRRPEPVVETKPEPVEKPAEPRHTVAHPSPPPEDTSRPVTKLDRRKSNEFVMKGTRLMSRRDYAGAETAYRRALDYDPDNMAAQRGLQAAQAARIMSGK